MENGREEPVSRQGWLRGCRKPGSWGWGRASRDDTVGRFKAGSGVTWGWVLCRVWECSVTPSKLGCCYLQKQGTSEEERQVWFYWVWAAFEAPEWNGFLSDHIVHSLADSPKMVVICTRGGVWILGWMGLGARRWWLRTGSCSQSERWDRGLGTLRWGSLRHMGMWWSELEREAEHTGCLDPPPPLGLWWYFDIKLI